MNRFASILLHVDGFLGAVPGAIAGHLNLAEVQRIAVATLLSGAGVAAIVPALLASVGTVIAPQDVAMVTAAITLVSEVRRRLPHGSPVVAKV